MQSAFNQQKQVGGGGGVLLFAVLRGRADFQGRLFDPKYFRQSANLGFNQKNILDRVENWVSAMNYFKNFLANIP